ncbi:MAG: hypothetical protein MZV70_45590 [Desulfobacterales bacterium]|nr:hypothetical protein [Desulfobacterales bacterium]
MRGRWRSRRPDRNLLAEYAGTVLAAPDPPAGVAAESITALRATLEQQPEDGAALWLLGFTAMKNRNNEEARRHWSKLLTQFAPGSGEYKAVEAQIVKLPSAPWDSPCLTCRLRLIQDCIPARIAESVHENRIVRDRGRPRRSWHFHGPGWPSLRYRPAGTEGAADRRAPWR